MKFPLSVDTAVVCMNSSRKERKQVNRGAVRNHLSDFLIWGAERIRLQNVDIFLLIVEDCNQ